VRDTGGEDTLPFFTGQINGGDVRLVPGKGQWETPLSSLYRHTEKQEVQQNLKFRCTIEQQDLFPVEHSAGMERCNALHGKIE